MRDNKCTKCNHYSLYVMPAAGKTICANCKSEFDTVKLSKGFTASSVK